MIPVRRGLISTMYARTRATLDDVYALYEGYYGKETAPFVRVRRGTFPELKDVVETNDCQIGLTYDADLEYVIVVSALDNLTKGAAGQAIQNFNLMHGFPETTGLV